MVLDENGHYAIPNIPLINAFAGIFDNPWSSISI